MKKVIIILLLLFSLLKGYSQFYRPFPEGEAVWTIESQHINGCPEGPGWITIYYSYIIHVGDTVINGISYHKIYREPIYNPLEQGTMPYLFADTGYAGALRQDIVLKQVFIILKDSSNETLLYDFSVDTLNAPFPNTFSKPDNSSKLFYIDTIWLISPNAFTLSYLYEDTVTDICGDGIYYGICEGIGGAGGG